MSGKKKQRKPKAKAITAKRVQATEDQPFEPGKVDIHPEPDSDAWGDDGLTLKQRRFCQYYVSEAAGNATEAAKLAGYKDDNRHVLEETGRQNMRKPVLRAFIGRLLARQGMTPDFLRSRLAELAASSLNNFATISPDGSVDVDLKQAAELGALGQLKEIREEVIKADGKVSVIKRTIKIHDPTPAIRTLAEMNGMLSGQPLEPERTIQRRRVLIGASDAVETDDN